MKIGGFQKVSLIDYPGRISAVVFTQGCNFRCPFCHNPELVEPERFEGLSPEAEILTFLEKRKGRLDAVVITGGEPTLQTELIPFIIHLKAMGYRIKLDTNGALPDVLEEMLGRGLLDYVAMDIKAPLERYSEVTKTKTDGQRILKSISLIMGSSVIMSSGQRPSSHCWPGGPRGDRAACSRRKAIRATEIRPDEDAGPALPQ